MFESLSTIPISALYSAGKDALSFSLNRTLKRNVKTLELRQKWRSQFEARVINCHRREVRRDVVICDLRRLDEAPKSTSVGIAASFRAGLIEAKSRGILLGLQLIELGKHFDGEHWRFLEAGERGTCFVLGGFIPYEVIDDVVWEGDEYRDFPHIYCRFDFDNEPYESLAFYSEQSHPHPDGPPYFSVIATLDDVQHFSPQALDDHLILNGLP